MIEENLVRLAASDADTASKMLETLPAMLETNHDPDRTASMCRVYMAVCAATHAPEVRIPALANLGELLDHLVGASQAVKLPGVDELTQFWTSLATGDLNPAASHAILQVSGPIMAAITLQGEANSSVTLARRLWFWAAMIHDAGDARKVLPSPAFPPHGSYKRRD